MALVSCPDCGAQVSDSAVVCAQCGFPLRRDVLASAGRGGGSSTGNTAGIIIGVAVAGLVGVVFIGILAALAIPRFTMASERAKELEGVGLLKQAYTLENAYLANNGVYAPTFEELKSVGWEDPVGLRHYTVEIASADSADLCLHALPRPGSGVRPIRVRTSGEIEHGVRCGEYAGGRDAASMDAMGVLGDVSGGVAAWRREHKRLPATQAELVEAYPSAADDPDFAMGLTPVGNGGLCVHIAPRTEPPSPVMLSLDGGGNVYTGDGCQGAPVQQLGR
jgi:type IV pilus assembly protein PilE